MNLLLKKTLSLGFLLLLLITKTAVSSFSGGCKTPSPKGKKNSSASSIERRASLSPNTLLRRGFRIDRNQAKKDNITPKARFTGTRENDPVYVLWGKLTQEKLRDFFKQYPKYDENPFSDYFIEREEGVFFVARFTIFPNGHLAIGKSGSFSRRHSNLAPAPGLVHKINVIRRKESLPPYEGPIFYGSYAVAAGRIYVPYPLREEGNLITVIDNKSGHYLLGPNSNKVAAAFFKTTSPDCINNRVILSIFYSSRALSSASSSSSTVADENISLREEDLTKATGFADFLEEAKNHPEATFVFCKNFDLIEENRKRKLPDLRENEDKVLALESGSGLAPVVEMETVMTML